MKKILHYLKMMKILRFDFLVIFTICTLGAMAQANSGLTEHVIKKIEFDEVYNTLIDLPESIVLIDVRGASEQDTSVISPSVIKLEDAESMLLNNLEVFKNKTVVIYSAFGKRAQQKALELATLLEEVDALKRPQLRIYSGVYDWAINGGSFYKTSEQEATTDILIKSDTILNSQMKTKLMENGFHLIE